MLIRTFAQVALALASLSFAFPVSEHGNQTELFESGETALKPRVVPNYQYYSAANPSQHQAYFNNYMSQGYRMISLSVYGTPPNVLYAAVWIQRTGPVLRAIHGASASTYQSWFDTNNAQGYVSTIVSVTGAVGSEIYAGQMEQISVSGWSQRCGLTAADFQANGNSAYSNNLILKSFRQYGTAANPRYCGLWHANANKNRWTYWYGMNQATWLVRDEAERRKRFWAPNIVTRSEDGLYTALYTDRDIGAFQVKTEMTSADLSSFASSASSAGLYPISIQGSGSGSGIRFAAIWAERDIPATRSWTVLGTATGFQNVAGVTNEIDSAMQQFMNAHGFRQAELSVYSRGSGLIDHSYTWAEASRTKTQIYHTFLLASVSKMFCAAAIQKLYNAGKLTASTKAYGYLGITNLKDSRAAQITVQQLVDHYGGYDSGLSGYDVVFNMRQVGFTLNPYRSVEPIDLVNYMATQRTLDRAPGSAYAYSNYGYILLSVLVERASGQSYINYLRANVFGGLNINPWTSYSGDHINDPVDQECPWTGESGAEPRNPYPVPNVYSGDGLRKEADLGGASLAASTGSIAKFIGTNAVWGIGGRAAGSLRYGSMDGASTCAMSRTDGLDFAIHVNSRDFWPGVSSSFNTLCETTINNILNRYPR